MTKILALSGKSQSGKSMSGNYLGGMVLKGADLIDYFDIDEKGKLVVPFRFGEEVRNEILDLQSQALEVTNWLAENLWPSFKIYSFADCLKSDICIRILGLTYEQVYGTDDQKNTPTKFKWEDMPTKTKNKGIMTAREVMQYVGTELFRKMYPKVWADATIARINEEKPDYAVIVDARFPDEIEAVQNNGGKVIRFTRNSKIESEHKSENALNQDVFDWSKFDKIIDNEDKEYRDTLAEVGRAIEEFGWLEGEQTS